MLTEGKLAVYEGTGAANKPRVVQLFANASFFGIKQASVTWCTAPLGAMLKQ